MKSMKQLTITMILLAIVAFCTASYFFIVKFSTPENVYKYPAPPFVPLTPTHSPTLIPTSVQSNQCSQTQLQATISVQGAAGNTYGTLTITNTGKTACSVTLGNTITETTTANNIAIHYQSTAPNETFMLAPNAKTYSQVHYPNGAQCQSGVSPKPITFLYKTYQLSLPLQSATAHTGMLMLQACNSETEKTTIDIWPLSKTPINP